MNQVDAPRLFKPKQSWERLNISQATWWRKVWAGQIKTVRIGRNHRVTAKNSSD